MAGESEVRRRGPFGSFVAVLRGIFWGVLVFGIILVAVSQLTPLPKAPPATATGGGATGLAPAATTTPTTVPTPAAPATPAPETPTTPSQSAAPSDPATDAASPAPSETTPPVQPESGATSPSGTGVDEGAALVPGPSGAGAIAVAAMASARIDLAGPAFDVNAQPFAAPADTALISVVLYGPEVSVLDASTLGLMHMPLTLAIRPAAPESRALAVLARAKGHEVLVELPIATSVGGAGLSAGDTPRVLGAAVTETMADLDMAVGATAPDGAEMLRSLDKMAALIGPLTEYGFAWIEPRRFADSAGERLASGSGMPFAQADLFGEPAATGDDVFRLLVVAAQLARSRGSVIIFLPASKNGLAAVIRWRQNRSDGKVRFAPISAVLRRRQAGQ